ncbi:MAG: VOC family protein, partial [Nocardioidaceae bacterium]|nr:VOC family protein [Nocardioidaceae bacterium]
MAYNFQVTFDTADPHVLADWWAEALGWHVEPSDEDFIRSMISQGFATDDDTTTHHG